MHEATVHPAYTEHVLFACLNDFSVLNLSRFTLHGEVF